MTEVADRVPFPAFDNDLPPASPMRNRKRRPLRLSTGDIPSIESINKPTKTMDIEAFVREMPKCELHVHLEGTLEPELARKLAERNKMPLPESIDALEQQRGYSFTDLPSFLKVYYGAMSVLRTSDDFFDLTYAYLEKCRRQKVVLTEMSFDPQAHTARGVPFGIIIEGIWRAVQKAKKVLGVRSSIIMCLLRDQGPGFAMATLMEALPYRKWITGVGLDSDERGHPPVEFKTVFKRATEEGFMTTVHCDVDQADSIEHIRQVLEDMDVDRIDHGTNIVEDARLMQIVKERGMGLTACPLSNSVISPDSKGKEIKQLLHQGIRVTVNSDDPAYFRGYMVENMLKVHDNGDGLSKEELLQLQVNAFNVSWAPVEIMNYYLGKLEDYRWETIF